MTNKSGGASMHRIGFRISVLVAIGITSFFTYGSADQLAVNSQEISKAVVAKLQPDSLVVEYCSLCDNQRIEVLSVVKADFSQSSTLGAYEVNLLAKRLFQSKAIIQKGQYKEPVEYERIVATKADESDLYVVRSVDLAYTYVSAAGNTYSNLCQLMNQKCDVLVSQITIPSSSLSLQASADQKKGFANFAVVDPQKLVQNSVYGKKRLDELRAYKDQVQAKLVKEHANSAKYKEAENDIQGRLDGILKGLEELTLPIIQKIGEDRNYAFILTSNELAGLRSKATIKINLDKKQVVYSNPKAELAYDPKSDFDDITKDVIEELDRKLGF
jgi:hypothetical protein